MKNHVEKWLCYWLFWWLFFTKSLHLKIKYLKVLCVFSGKIYPDIALLFLDALLLSLSFEMYKWRMIYVSMSVSSCLKLGGKRIKPKLQLRTVRCSEESSNVTPNWRTRFLNYIFLLSPTTVLVGLLVFLCPSAETGTWQRASGDVTADHADRDIQCAADCPYSLQSRECLPVRWHFPDPVINNKNECLMSCIF